jgi:hypothetical protein
MKANEMESGTLTGLELRFAVLQQSVQGVYGVRDHAQTRWEVRSQPPQGEGDQRHQLRRVQVAEPASPHADAFTVLLELACGTDSSGGRA